MQCGGYFVVQCYQLQVVLVVNGELVFVILGWFYGLEFRQFVFGFGQVVEVLVDLLQYLCWIEFVGDEQYCVVGLVVGVVECLEVFDVYVFDVVVCVDGVVVIVVLVVGYVLYVF